MILRKKLIDIRIIKNLIQFNVAFILINIVWYSKPL